MFYILYPARMPPVKLTAAHLYINNIPQEWMTTGNDLISALHSKIFYDRVDGENHLVLEYDEQGNLVRQLTEEEIGKYLVLL